jgi:hypothetical protein
MSFFVISKGDWGIRADVFMQQLRARWPAVAIREITSPDSNFCLDFDLVLKHSRVDGSLHRTGKSFHFDSDLRDAAQLALWFRALAPNTEPLVFCDDSMSGMLDLEPTTTEEDIFLAFDYSPAPPGWMNYHLIARGGWGMPPRSLVQRMRERWPSARLVENEESENRWFFEFHLPMSRSEVSGKIERKVNALVFTGDLRDCAELALWWRSVVPTEQLLLTCDQGDLYLKANTSADDIVRAFATTRSGT